MKQSCHIFAKLLARFIISLAAWWFVTVPVVDHFYLRPHDLSTEFWGPVFLQGYVLILLIYFVADYGLLRRLQELRGHTWRYGLCSLATALASSLIVARFLASDFWSNFLMKQGFCLISLLDANSGDVATYCALYREDAVANLLPYFQSLFE